MSKPKALREAEARLAELEGLEAAWEAHKAERDAAIEPNRARQRALHKRHEKVQLLTKAGGQPNSVGGGITLTSLAGITPAYGWMGYGDHREYPKAGDLAKRILSGDQRVLGNGGTAYTLRGLLDRTVIVDKPRMAPVNRAVAARRRAEQRLAAAWRAEREAYATAFAAGTKLDREQVAKEIARRASIPTEPTYDRELEPNHQVHWQIEEAKQHIAWLKSNNPDKDVCPCGTCVRERRDVADQKREDARIAALPTQMFTCPEDGKRHRGSIEVVTVREHQLSDALKALLDEKAPGWRDLGERGDYGYMEYQLNRIWDPRHKTWRTDLSAIAKRAAKLATAKAKRERGAKVEWTCPNPECAEQVITNKPNAGDEVIECPVCGIEATLASLALRRYVGPKPVTTDEDADEEAAA